MWCDLIENAGGVQRQVSSFIAGSYHQVSYKANMTWKSLTVQTIVELEIGQISELDV